MVKSGTKTKVIEREKINSEDIDLNFGDFGSKNQKNVIIEASESEFGQKNQEMEASAAPKASKDDLFFPENSSFGSQNWAERLQRALIPSKMYQELEYWLSFDLGSRLKPEAWLLRVEISIVLGVALAVAALWMPVQGLVTVLGISMTLLVYLYLT
jgi:hypothetical protein